MNRAYAVGLCLVIGTVAVASVLAPRVPQHSEPAGHDLSATPLPIGSFRLTERSGETIADADLADKVWIAAFIFTRCPATCPIISGVMKDMQPELAGTGVRLVSISVDPEYDTPEVLSAFARKYDADPNRWWFLTGPKDEVYRLVLDDFKLPVGANEDTSAEAEPILHSTRLVLVDRGNRIVGLYEARDQADVAQLVARARRLDLQWVTKLPALNATLNASCAALLLLGWTMIRAGRVRVHTTCMITALAVSAVFLTSYLIYHYHVGSVPFPGVGVPRAVYFTVLISHTVLAIVAVPLILLTLYRALRRQWPSHAKIARVTFPIWLYVSVTGVVVYLMLYQMDFATTTMPSP